MNEPFIEELGSHLRIEATRVGCWIKLHNRHNARLRPQWVHERELSVHYSWKDRCKDMLTEFVTEPEPKP